MRRSPVSYVSDLNLIELHSEFFQSARADNWSHALILEVLEQSLIGRLHAAIRDCDEYGSRELLDQFREVFEIAQSATTPRVTG